MKIIKSVKWALVLLLPVFASTGNAAGVIPSSYPLFENIYDTVLVREQTVYTSPNTSDSYWTLTGTGSTSLFMGGLTNFVNVGDANVHYQANFNAQGQLITAIDGVKLNNSLEITGSLPKGTFNGTSWADQPNQLLLSANLVNPTGTSNGNALGFNTQFTGGWVANNTGLTGGSMSESLWLLGLNPDFKNLVNFVDGKGVLSPWSTYNAISIASVPLPAAVWLFGAGLMAVLGARRKSAGLKLAV
ncbi:MAG: VPLPA-CTERM sorting domain-containing protein [Methylococcales bacterium]|nr:VPLPA-CTERM sorting domain-containing protein [Methylococcales bacterium]